MKFSWEAPSAGIVSEYLSTTLCLGPNEGSEQIMLNISSSDVFVFVKDLEPGSICNINVTTQITDAKDTIYGDSTIATIGSTTLEDGKCFVILSVSTTV